MYSNFTSDYWERFYALIVAGLYANVNKKKRSRTKRKILRDKRDKAYNMKTVDNNPYAVVYVIYFNPDPSISPSKTSISIEVHGRWNQVFSLDVYIRGHSADWCPRQTRFSSGVFTPFIIDSIIPSPDFWGRASKIRVRLISPGGKKTYILRLECELTKEHPIRVEQPTPLVIYEREKREKKRRRWIWSWEWQIRFRIFPIAATSGK